MTLLQQCGVLMSQSSVDVIRQQNRWVLGSALALSVVLAWSVMAQGLDILYDENQMMEHLQLLVLLVTGRLFWRSQWSALDGLTTRRIRLLRHLALTASLLCFSFFVREMSVKQSGVDWLIYLVDGTGFKILMALIWLPLLLFLSRNVRAYVALLWQSVPSRFFIFSMVSMGLLLLGAVFDKEIFKPAYFRFYEEVAELNGYFWLLAAALNFERDMIRDEDLAERPQFAQA